MNGLHEIRFRDLWREQVIESVDWERLLHENVRDMVWFICICLDLFHGSDLRHNPSSSNIICSGCPRVNVEEGNPWCELHLGIVEAFWFGIMKSRIHAERSAGGTECLIKTQKQGIDLLAF